MLSNSSNPRRHMHKISIHKDVIACQSCSETHLNNEEFSSQKFHNCRMAGSKCFLFPSAISRVGTNLHGAEWESFGFMGCGGKYCWHSHRDWYVDRDYIGKKWGPSPSWCTPEWKSETHFGLTICGCQCLAQQFILRLRTQADRFTADHCVGKMHCEIPRQLEKHTVNEFWMPALKGKMGQEHEVRNPKNRFSPLQHTH